MKKKVRTKNNMNKEEAREISGLVIEYLEALHKMQDVKLNLMNEIHSINEVHTPGWSFSIKAFARALINILQIDYKSSEHVRLIRAYDNVYR